jgi:hypothetical protein
MNLHSSAWVIFIALGTMAIVAGALQFQSHVKEWNRRAGSPGKRALLYVALVIVIVGLVYLQITNEGTTQQTTTSTSPTISSSEGTATGTVQATIIPTITETSPAVSSTSTSTRTQSNTSADAELRKKQWEVLDRAIVATAKSRAPDYEEVIAPDRFSTEINCQQHNMKIWAFDLSQPAEGYWFFGGGEADMVVAPCVDRGNWQNCTPTTDSNRPPKYMRLHNPDQHHSLEMKLWFVQYGGPQKQ